MPSLRPEAGRDDDSRTPRARAARARGPRRVRRTRAAHPGAARRLRIRPHVAAAAAARPDRPLAGAVHRRRADRDDAGALPAVACATRRRSRRILYGRRPAEHGARDAFDAALAFLDTARAPGDAPATFLLDEFLELRTFESFPGPALACCATWSGRWPRAATASCCRRAMSRARTGCCATRRRSSRSSTSRR